MNARLQFKRRIAVPGCGSYDIRIIKLVVNCKDGVALFLGTPTDASDQGFCECRDLPGKLSELWDDKTLCEFLQYEPHVVYQAALEMAWHVRDLKTVLPSILGMEKP